MSKALGPALFARLLVVVCLFAGFTSCSSRRNLTEKPLPNRPPQFLIKKLDANKFDFDWLSAKINSKVKMKEKSYSFKTTLRVRKDSCIWVSMSPAMGIEAARIVITQDSIKFVNKIEKQFLIASFDDINKKLTSDIDFALLQDFIIGQPVGFDHDAKYKSKVDTSRLYRLTMKNPRRVRKAVEIKKDDKKKYDIDSTMNIGINDRRLDKALDKKSGEDLFIMRYWLNGDDYNLAKVVINDLRQQGMMQLLFREYLPIEEQDFPHESELFVTNLEGQISVRLKYSKVKLNNRLKMPFKINSKYVEIAF